MATKKVPKVELGTDESTPSQWMTGFWEVGGQSLKASLTFPLLGATLAEQVAYAKEVALTFANAGFLAQEKGLEPGERKQLIAMVLRRVYEDNDTGDETNAIEYWPERGKFRFVQQYLNTVEQLKAFEAASGLKVADLPIFEGGSIERGKSKKAERMMVKVETPFTVVRVTRTKKVEEIVDGVAKVVEKPRHYFQRFEGADAVSTGGGGADDNTDTSEAKHFKASVGRIEVAEDKNSNPYFWLRRDDDGKDFPYFAGRQYFREAITFEDDAEWEDWKVKGTVIEFDPPLTIHCVQAKPASATGGRAKIDIEGVDTWEGEYLIDVPGSHPDDDARPDW